MKSKVRQDFFNLYAQGFVRTAVCTPEVRIGDPAFNAVETIRLARQAAEASACLALFPELGLSAYSSDDLFHQDALLKGVDEALTRVAAETETLNLILAVGAPAGSGESALQLRRGPLPRPDPRGGRQILSPELPGILRGAAVQPLF
jgi:predicted amidohydrolase